MGLHPDLVGTRARALAKLPAGRRRYFSMRIFIGIDLNDEIRGRIARFLEGVSGFAPEARWVRPESLHVTLKFIGEQKMEQVAAITERLLSALPARRQPPKTVPPLRRPEVRKRLGLSESIV